MNAPATHQEIEYKFRIPQHLALDVSQLLTDAGLNFTQEATRSMQAHYYDTPRLSLLRWGVTLRRRTGGGDDGWHMKLPQWSNTSASTRDELRIERDDTSVPFELTAIIAPLLRRQDLELMAEVRTEREPFTIKNSQGVSLVEVVDDHVAVHREGNVVSFREVEVELLDGSPDAITAAHEVCARVQSAGGEPSSVSKAAQALGKHAGEPPDVPLIDHPDPAGVAVDALQAIFSGYVRALLLADVDMRRGIPDSVHQMRVACRRLRSALKTFRPILDPDAVTFLREELAWLATELGEVRDTEVQLQALAFAIEDEDARSFVTETLNARMRAAQSSALAAVRSDRHDFLLEDLIILVAEPPVSAAAFDAADSTIHRCVRRTWRRLSRSVSATTAKSPADDWHRIRILAKQARYAVEAAAPLFGDDYKRLGKSLAWVTDTLGSKQDAQVSISTLHEIAQSAPGPVAFQLGVQAARFANQSGDDVRDFSRRWPRIVEQAHRLGLDG